MKIIDYPAGKPDKKIISIRKAKIRIKQIRLLCKDITIIINDKPFKI